MSDNLSELIPDFEPLLSFDLADHEDGLNSRLPAPVSTTLRALSADPSTLNRVTVDYLSVSRNAKSRKEFKEAYAALDTKHAHILAALKAVQYIQSGRASIYAMTPELLTLVFESSIRFRAMGGPHHILSEPFDMRLRAVCRLWRDIIDNTPALWARVDLRKPVDDLDHLRLILKRSKRFPLQLVVYVNAMDVHVFAAIFPEIARTRYLELNCNLSWRINERLANLPVEQRAEAGLALFFMQQLIESPAPVLEELQSDSLQHFPPTIFKQTTPPLRYIEVRNCPLIPPTSCLFRAADVTVLSISDSRAWGSIDEMLRFLATTPNIKDFWWDTYAPASLNDLPFQSPSDFEPKSVRLRQLKAFHLVVAIETAMRVILILDFPVTAQFDINGSFLQKPEVGTPAFQSLLDNIRLAFRPYFQKLFSGDMPRYRDVYINRNRQVEDDTDGINLALWNFNAFEITPSFDFSMFWSGDDCREEYAAVVLDILGWPKIPHELVKFYVEHNTFMHRDAPWRRVLITLPELAEVYVTGPSALALFRALYEDAVVHPSRTTALQKIIVNHAKARTMAFVLRVLDRRVEQGLRRLQLELKMCEIETVVIVQLRLHRGVKQVEWDGENHAEFVKRWVDYEEEDIPGE